MKKFRLISMLVVSGYFLVSCGVPQGPVAAPSSPTLASREADSYTTAKRKVVTPRERKGLATGWGDEINAPMNYTSFQRASDKPAGGVSTIYYNDEAGAESMGTNLRWKRPAMQSTANGLVSWGVKSGYRKLRNYHWRRGRMVVGRKGKGYSLMVKNNSRNRLETVMSVDGLDVIDGKPASLRKRGYLVAPGKTLEVKGFRTSEEAVAAFKFAGVPNSYANLRHGNTRNVGVMGLAVFTEKGIDPWGRNIQENKHRGGARAFADAPVQRARN